MEFSSVDKRAALTIKTETSHKELPGRSRSGARGDVQTPYTCSSCADIALGPDGQETLFCLFDVLIDYVFASGTVDVEPVTMVFPTADLGAFFGEDIAAASALIIIP